MIKKLILSTLATYLLAFYPLDIYGQDLDPSLLQNLTLEQIEILKEELDQKNISVNEKPLINESTTEIKLVEDEIDSKTDALKKYGYNFFRSAPTSVTAVGDLPLPAEYKISILDQFTVILSGSKQGIFDLNVQLDGTIFFPELGSISVAGETFGEVKKKLRNIIEQSYIGVNLDLSLKNLAAKKITIVGAVNNPGTYLVNPFSTISSALAYSGGISEIGSLRNIKLIRSNNQEFYFDLYKLLIDGDRTEDINIQAGDVILVNPARQFIELNGQINRPAIYEIKEGDTFKDLIRFGAGFTNIANKKNIDYKVLDIDSSSIRLLSNQDMNSVLTNIISVQVNPYNSKNSSNIMVFGAVKEPGYYKLYKNETFENFIERLEFINLYPWAAVLEQYDDKNYVRKSILINLNDKNTYDSIEMIPNTKLFFLSTHEIETFIENNIEKLDEEEVRSEFITNNQVEKEVIMNHGLDLSKTSRNLLQDYSLRINYDGSSIYLPVYGKFNLKSFVDFLGLDMTTVDPKVTYVSPFDDLTYNDDYRNSNFIANKFHTASFRNLSNDLITVTIDGAVDFPGSYTLKSNATISDLYKLIGQFKKQAFFEGITLTRESVKERQIESLNKSKKELNDLLIMQSNNSQEQIDISFLKELSEEINPEYLGRIAGNFSPSSKSINNTILKNGDMIFVPIIPNTISVFGEVQNQLSFGYSEGMNARRAIELAGGFNEFASKRKVYIIKANGLTAKANSFLIGNYKLQAGDTVVVPRRVIVENKFIKALQPVTNVISDLAFSAAALESLSNSN